MRMRTTYIYELRRFLLLFMSEYGLFFDFLKCKVYVMKVVGPPLKV